MPVDIKPEQIFVGRADFTAGISHPKDIGRIKHIGIAHEEANILNEHFGHEKHPQQKIDSYVENQKAYTSPDGLDPLDRSAVILHKQTEEAEFYKEQSTVDFLTGLKNRRYHDEMLQRELLRSIREGRVVGLLLGDLRDLKGFNDTYGHAGGDKAIITIAKDLQASRLRPSDSFCRIGGDEYSGIFPDISPHQAGLTNKDSLIHVAFRVLHSIAEKPLQIQSGKTAVPLSLDSGLTLSVTGDTVQSISERADNASYLAKKMLQVGDIGACVSTKNAMGITYELVKEIDGVLSFSKIVNALEILRGKPKK
jgi:diguanylate cyclase (GGDEF)-like protein